MPLLRPVSCRFRPSLNRASASFVACSVWPYAGGLILAAAIASISATPALRPAAVVVTLIVLADLMEMLATRRAAQWFSTCAREVMISTRLCPLSARTWGKLRRFDARASFVPGARASGPGGPGRVPEHKRFPSGGRGTGGTLIDVNYFYRQSNCR